MRELTIEELKAMPDEDIDLSDIPEADEAFWRDAMLVFPDGTRKTPLYVDTEIAEWFRQRGGNLHSLANIALREYIAAHQ